MTLRQSRNRKGPRTRRETLTLTLFALLKSSSSLRRLFGAQLQSELGTSAAYVALVLVAYHRLHSAWAIAVVMLADFVPGIVLAVPFGALADRFSRKRLVVGADLLRAAAFLALAVDPVVRRHRGICARRRSRYRIVPARVQLGVARDGLRRAALGRNRDLQRELQHRDHRRPGADGTGPAVRPGDVDARRQRCHVPRCRGRAPAPWLAFGGSHSALPHIIRHRSPSPSPRTRPRANANRRGQPPSRGRGPPHGSRAWARC